ncbi:MAG: hypothetical protein ACRBB0_14535 [Pelagimonas sp.]|uniref:hypothetical protein n=1 Tax=Pelagimonas sp. TaxID=2073170 RepID=UPI003D6AE53C
MAIRFPAHQNDMVFVQRRNLFEVVLAGIGDRGREHAGVGSVLRRRKGARPWLNLHRIGNVSGLHRFTDKLGCSAENFTGFGLIIGWIFFGQQGQRSIGGSGCGNNSAYRGAKQRLERKHVVDPSIGQTLGQIKGDGSTGVLIGAQMQHSFKTGRFGRRLLR